MTLYVRALAVDKQETADSRNEQLVARGKHKPDRHCKDEQLGRLFANEEAINRQMTGTVKNGPTYGRIAEVLTSHSFPPTSLFTSHAELHVLLLAHAPHCPEKGTFCINKSR
ncbi:hypothetical protein P3447_27370 [Vibrio parahaemolyticus]|nr:hypothetical protein [Vibrio parahaemolyticus]